MDDEIRVCVNEGLSKIESLTETLNRIVGVVDPKTEKIPLNTFGDVRVVSVDNGYIVHNAVEGTSAVFAFDEEQSSPEARKSKLGAIRAVLYSIIGAFEVYSKHEQFNIECVVEDSLDIQKILKMLSDMGNPFSKEMGYLEVSDEVRDKVQKVLDEGNVGMPDISREYCEKQFEKFIAKIIKSVEEIGEY